MVRYSGPVFISNEKNFNVEVYRVKGDTRTTVINTLENPSSIIPLDPERTIWTYATVKYWDYSAEKYEVYYSSDICERRLELEIPKSQFGDKAGFADFVYNNLTYRTYTKDHIHDYISGIQYPDGTQYLIKDSRAVGLVGDETIYGTKTFTNRIHQKTNYDVTDTSTADYGIIKDIFDKNGEEIGIECVEMRNNILTHYIDARRTVNGQWHGSGLRAHLNLSTFESWAEAPTPSSVSDYSNKIATTQWVKNSIRGKILANNLSQKTGVITLNESIQNFPILLFGVGPVASYQYSTCVVTPFAGRLNSYRDFSWSINGDTIRLNFTNGQTSASSQMITLKITSNVSVEIVTNTGNMEIRGIFGLSFN